MASNEWDFTPPPPSELGDREVPRVGSHLAHKRVALLVSGGIAAFKAPLLARALRRQGAEVVAFASEEALRYVTAEALEWATLHPVVSRLTAAAEHLSDEAPFDAYLLAPATYNSIHKLRYGIADGVVSASLVSALGRMEQGRTRLLVAPTMHGSMHTSILTEALRFLAGLGVRIIPPREDYGKHNLPSEDALVAEVCRAVSASPLKGQPILVTGGPTPVPLDGVRRITNIFTGELGARIAEELYLRGADVHLVHGISPFNPPAHLPHTLIRTYAEYRTLVRSLLAEKPHLAGIFSAGVADYAPREVRPGKTPSGDHDWPLTLSPVPKVIDEVRAACPDLFMVTFKYQEGMSHEELMSIARARLDRFPAVIANRGDERGAHGEQVAYLVTANREPQRWVGKSVIARELADFLEQHLGGNR